MAGMLPPALLLSWPNRPPLAALPPAAFYMVLGSLYLKADSWMLEREDAATEAAYRRCNLGTMCLSFG